MFIKDNAVIWQGVILFDSVSPLTSFTVQINLHSVLNAEVSSGLIYFSGVKFFDTDSIIFPLPLTNTFIIDTFPGKQCYSLITATIVVE